MIAGQIIYLSLVEYKQVESNGFFFHEESQKPSLVSFRNMNYAGLER